MSAGDGRAFSCGADTEVGLELLRSATFFLLGDVLVGFCAPVVAALSELPGPPASTIQEGRFPPTNWLTVLFLLATSATSASCRASLCASVERPLFFAMVVESEFAIDEIKLWFVHLPVQGYLIIKRTLNT